MFDIKIYINLLQFISIYYLCSLHPHKGIESKSWSPFLCPKSALEARRMAKTEGSINPLSLIIPFAGNIFLESIFPDIPDRTPSYLFCSTTSWSLTVSAQSEYLWR